MPSFSGTYEHSLDQKGRLSIPTRIREILIEEYKEEKIYLTMLDDCIEVYPLKEWEKKEAKLRTLPSRDKEVRLFLIAHYSRAFDSSLDRSGRVLIPPQMRNKCGINGKVAIIGVMDHFEIWPLEKWEGKEKEFEENKYSINKKVAELGI